MQGTARGRTTVNTSSSELYRAISDATKCRSTAVRPVPVEADLSRDVLRLRRAMSSGSQPAWHTAHIVVTASGWPEPRISADARFDYPDEGGSTGRSPVR